MRGRRARFPARSQAAVRPRGGAWPKVPGMPSLLPLPTPARLPRASRAPQVEIVVPVHDEEAALRPIRRLHGFLTDELPVLVADLIADNASTDATPRSRRGSPPSCPASRPPPRREGPRPRAARRLDGSDAEVVAYMDVDLSTDLRALLPLVRRCSPATATSPSAPASRRRARRARPQARADLARATTASCARRCGRASATRSAASRRSAPTLPAAAARWSRTRAGSSTPSCSCSRSTAGCASTRCRSTGSTTRTRASRSSHRDRRPARRGPPDRGQPMAGSSASAALHPRLRPAVPLLRGPLGPAGANALALALTAVGNTAANRRLTFGVRGRAGLARQHVEGALVFVLTLALTNGALASSAASTHVRPGRSSWPSSSPRAWWRPSPATSP